MFIKTLTMDCFTEILNFDQTDCVSFVHRYRMLKQSTCGKTNTNFLKTIALMLTGKNFVFLFLGHIFPVFLLISESESFVNTNPKRFLNRCHPRAWALWRMNFREGKKEKISNKIALVATEGKNFYNLMLQICRKLHCLKQILIIKSYS